MKAGKLPFAQLVDFVRTQRRPLRWRWKPQPQGSVSRVDHLRLERFDRGINVCKSSVASSASMNQGPKQGEFYWL